MKKTIAIFLILFGVMTGGVAQVMQNTGVQSTAWTGFGLPFKGGFSYYGVIDCLQTRFDIGMFTVEGMINWGVMTNFEADGDFDNVTFANTETNGLMAHYHGYHNGGYGAYYDAMNTTNYDQDEVKLDKDGKPIERWRQSNDKKISNAVIPQTAQSPYYVNFLLNPIEGLSIGMGTKLNWQVGVAPGYNGWLWEADTHIRQGGFSTRYDDRDGPALDKNVFTPDAPGSADVVGYVHYANKYAKNALGIRYVYEGDFGLQVGLAIPTQMDTDHFLFNLAAEVRPIKWLLIAAAYEGLLHKDGDLYVGLSFNFKYFDFDAYFAWDGIDFDSDDDMANSVGVAFSIKLLNERILLRPETAINWFENSDWLPSWYVGLLFRFDVNEKITIQAWASFALGSTNKKWDDYDETEDWYGGNIFDIRPEFTFHFNQNHSLSAYVDLENRNSFDRENRFGFSTGVYWTYKLFTGKLEVMKKQKANN